MQMIDDIPVWGTPQDNAVEQMRTCKRTAFRVALMADHHLGYAVPIGGVVAYKGRISPSGVGYDIACGNKAVLIATSDSPRSLPTTQPRSTSSTRFVRSAWRWRVRTKRTRTRTDLTRAKTRPLYKQASTAVLPRCPPPPGPAVRAVHHTRWTEQTADQERGPEGEMAQQRRPAGLAWKRLPNVNETAKVLEPGAPDIVTVEVPSRDPNVKEPENIVYVRLDVLPENIRRQAGWIVAEKTLGRKLTAEDIKIFGALGLRNLDLGEES